MKGIGIALFAISAVLNIVMAGEFLEELRRIRELEDINAKILRGRKHEEEEIRNEEED